jgi:hypothetical protein
MSTPPPSQSARRPANLSVLGADFEDWLRDHGRWVVYARADRRFKCRCYDQETQSSGLSQDGGPPSPGDNDCPLCFGTGYKTGLERMKSYVAYDIRKTYSTRSGIAPAYVGEVDTSGAVIYLRGGAYPQKLDLVFETEWDVPYSRVATQGTPTRLVRAWEIMNPAPAILGSEGAVDLYMAGMRSHGEELVMLERNLRGAGPRIQPPGKLEGITPRQDRPYGGMGGNRYGQSDVPAKRGIKPPFV